MFRASCLECLPTYYPTDCPWRPKSHFLQETFPQPESGLALLLLGLPLYQHISQGLVLITAILGLPTFFSLLHGLGKHTTLRLFLRNLCMKGHSSSDSGEIGVDWGKESRNTPGGFSGAHAVAGVWE